MLRAFLASTIGLLAACCPMYGVFAAPPALDALHCGARIAVLGADLAPAQRTELLQALQAGAQTIVLTETVSDETAGAQGLIPPSLIGKTAISSSLFHPLPAGTGLTISVNPGIVLDTPRAYANALLTAGITDGEVRVAAPLSDKKWGATVLPELLRAGHITCLKLDPVREHLALREIALTSNIALASPQPAAVQSLMGTLKEDAVTHHLTDPAALGALVTRDGRARGVTIPSAYQQAVIGFLHDLVASGAYAGIVAAHPAFSVTAGQTGQLRVHLAPPGAAVVPGTHGHPSPVPTSKAGFVKGTLVAASASGITIRAAGGTHHFAPATGLQVYRNKERATLGALKAGDTVSASVDAAGRVTLIEATGPGAPAVFVTRTATQGPNIGAISVLAVLILLVLVALPLLVGYARRRQTQRLATARSRRGQRRAGPRTAQATPAAAPMRPQTPSSDTDDGDS